MLTALFDFVIPFVVVLGVLVFIHELGHYFAAKIFGMKVDAFSLGFPPRAWGFRWGTRRLKSKFQKDIMRALRENPGFEEIHRVWHSQAISRDEWQTAELLNAIFDIRREDVEEEVVNKKGKTEKVTKTVIHHSLRKNEADPYDRNAVDVAAQVISTDANLPELLAFHRQIHDERAFHESWKTDYCLSWIPLGGYCKINGMVDESFDPDSMKEGEPRPWEYRAKPVWQRMIAITGGVFFNFVLAVIIFAAVALINGVPDMDQYKDFKIGTKISSVVSGSPAEMAGLTAGDEIVAVDDEAIDDWKVLVSRIHDKPGQAMKIEWMRGPDRMKAVVVPNRGKAQTSEGVKEVGQIGIVAPPMPNFTREASVPEAAAYGITYTTGMTLFIVRSIKQIIFGEQSFKEAMGGPVAIFRMTGEVKQQRGWEGIWSFMALLSISLAIFNLFPIPALDGGHLVFLLIEAIIRRPVSIRIKLYAQQAGMALLLTFIAYVIYNDLAKWHGGM